MPTGRRTAERAAHTVVVLPGLCYWNTQVLVDLLPQPTQGVRIDQPDTCTITPVFAAAMHRRPEIEEGGAFGHHGMLEPGQIDALAHADVAMTAGYDALKFSIAMSAALLDAAGLMTRPEHRRGGVASVRSRSH